MAKNTKAKTIASIKRKRTQRLASLITRSYFLHRRKEEEKMYNLICEEFMSLGGVYVKFLQGVLLRSRVMRKWHNPDKLRIFENLDTEPIDIGSVLRSELSKEALSNIVLVQPLPFAAGSFGQVYLGQLRNGKTIIIKVLRPMIRELLKHDIKLLNTFSKTFFTKLYKNMSLQINDALQDFAQATLRETDYKHEALFANEMYQRYKNHDTIHIPETYLDLCTDNVIVQDYVDGISVAHIVQQKEKGINPVDYVREHLGSDLITQLRSLGFESLVGIFEMKRVQGDPHPGNIRIMKNNKIGLIDFGISAQPPEDKSGLFGLLETYDKVFKGSQTATGLFENGLKFFVSDLYRSLKRIGEYLGKSNDRDYVNEVSKVAEEIFIQSTGSSTVAADLRKDTSILETITTQFNKGNRFGLIVKLEATEILRAIQTFSSLLSTLGMLHDVMPDTLSRSVDYIKTHHPEATKDSAESVSMGEAIETVANWLERIANKDPLLFRQISEKINASTAIAPIVNLATETKGS